VQNAFAYPGGWVDLVNPYGSPTNPWIASPPAGTGGIMIGKSPELRLLDVIGWTLADTQICMRGNTRVSMHQSTSVLIRELASDTTLIDYAGKPVKLVESVCIQQENAQFVCISKGALGANIPSQDLCVCPGHPVLINGREVDCLNLIDGRNITLLERCTEPIYTLITEQRTFVDCQGVLVGTWSPEAWQNFIENDQLGRALLYKLQ
jgi:hypothetical protein